MIESKALGSAAGIQNQGVTDKPEGMNLPLPSNGVIIGRFKRGRIDKPFKVTASNYQALLGCDPFNPSYVVVEDAFKRGVSEVSILRTGGIFIKTIIDDVTTDEISAFILSMDSLDSGALDYAVSQLIGDSVAWSLDVGSKSIVYTTPSTEPHQAPIGKIWCIDNFAATDYEKLKEYGSVSIYEAAQKASDLYGYGSYVLADITGSSARVVAGYDSRFFRNMYTWAYPLDDIERPTVDNYTPVHDVSQKILTNADGGDANSIEFVKNVIANR